MAARSFPKAKAVGSSPTSGASFFAFSFILVVLTSGILSCLYLFAGKNFLDYYNPYLSVYAFPHLTL